MADKNVLLKNASGDSVFPLTKLENITVTAGPAITISGNSIGCKTASTSVLGVCKFNSTYFTVSSGNVTPKAAGASQKGVVQLATAAEAVTGTNTSKAVTPAGLKAALQEIQLHNLSDVVNSEVIMNPNSNPTTNFILIYNPATKKWQPSNWLSRLFGYLGSAMGNIGTPFDSNDIS